MNKLCNQKENNEKEIKSIYADQKEKFLNNCNCFDLLVQSEVGKGFSSIDFPCNLAIARHRTISSESLKSSKIIINDVNFISKLC